MVNWLEFYGYILIVVSLSVVGWDLSGVMVWDCMVILIMDGEEICNGDLVVVVVVLCIQNVVVLIYVVGFDFDVD